MDAVRGLSLLDLADREAIDWYVCYCNRESPRWWNEFLKPEYQHVQLRREIRFGPELNDVLWLVADPGLSHISVKLLGVEAAPWFDKEILHFQRVQAAPKWWRVREWLFLGPITCVEITKTFLGISSWRVRTPWQLFKYLEARNCVLR